MRTYGWCSFARPSRCYRLKKQISRKMLKKNFTYRGRPRQLRAGRGVKYGKLRDKNIKPAKNGRSQGVVVSPPALVSAIYSNFVPVFPIISNFPSPAFCPHMSRMPTGARGRLVGLAEAIFPQLRHDVCDLGKFHPFPHYPRPQVPASDHTCRRCTRKLAEADGG